MEEKGAEAESQETKTSDSSFVWDEATQLYFHSSSGFYHDPEAGWYYSSRDGLYYKFENGSYVLLASDEVDNGGGGGADPGDTSTSGEKECGNNEESAPEIPLPPSEWLEETLINMYLSGYNRSVDAADCPMMSLDMDDGSDNDAREFDEGDGVAGEVCDLTTDTSESLIDEDISRDEENWRSQYGQVVHSGEESVLDSFLIDLWDWAMVRESNKGGQCQDARLVGRLVKQSAKLHPSMPSSSSLFRTAPICEANLDLVRVRTGKVYKLRNPSVKYLASLSTYDSSNPTKDWGFPGLSISMQDIPQIKSSGKSQPKSADCKGMSISTNQVSASEKINHSYRDRAAERRSLHGGYGVGHGQKTSLVGDVGDSSSPDNPEEAAAEAMNISFGAGSYARKILETMGWREGEALGNTRKGLVEPIIPVGNIGNAGLGWTQRRRKN